MAAPTSLPNPATVWRSIGQRHGRATTARTLRLRVSSVSRKRVQPWGNQGRVQQNKASTGLWQRAGLIMLFAIMTGAGVGAYAGYARLVRSPGGESLAHVRRASLPPSLWVRAAHPVTDDHAPDEIGTWFAKAEDLAAVAAMIVFSDVANSVASAL